MLGDLPQTRGKFLQRFDGASQRALDDLEQEARQHAEAGRVDQAREAFDRALAARPRDWRLIGEVAEFVIRSAGDYEAGLRLAHTALALNPWYSVWLWNVIGDALFALDRFDEAHEAYMEARRIEPTDVRTSLNLAYTHGQFADFQQALTAIAEGLAFDKTGLFRQRLLEKQQHILTLAEQKWAADKEWEGRRMQRLSQ
jgi:tetratricopeptide (TPR) repeat protein